MAVAMPADASWVKRFGVSDQEYRVMITTTDKVNTTYGFYLTSFPCYSQNSSEYYKTIAGSNYITLYCLEPPSEIYLAYATRPNGAFVSRNMAMDGYMLCPVKIAGLGAASVIPRLEAVVQECEKREINKKGNRQILSMGLSKAGEKVGQAMAEDAAKKPEPAPKGALVGQYETQAEAEKAGQTPPPADASKVFQPDVKPETDVEEE
ncbi:MAG: hypothetical protein LBI17_01330 [Rickettsiales bacterium]|nr:hypothetical protein [Rickettsiales bacterium]